MRSELTLQIRHQLPQRLAFFRHYIGQQQAVQHPIPFRQKARVTDAARFLSSDQDVVLHHQIGDVLESDLRFVKFAAILGGNAVEHAGCIERAHHVTRPLLALQQPAQKNAEDFVRVYKAPIFRDRADAVGIAIGRQSGVTLLTHHCLLQQSNVRFNGLGIDARKKRIQFLPDGNVLNPALAENPRKNPAARAVHGVDGNLELGFANEVHVGKPANGSDVRGLEVNLFHGCLRTSRHRPSAQFLFHPFHDGWSSRPAKLPFKLHSVPVPGIVAGCDHDSTRGAVLFHRIGNRGSGCVIVRHFHPDTRGGDHFRSHMRRALRSETRVITDENSA